MSVTLDPKTYKEYQSFYTAYRNGCYKPWVSPHSVASDSHRTLFKCKKVGRQMTMMSNGELDLMMQSEGRLDVINAYEQFALDPIQTLRIAKSFGIHHPVIRKSRGKWLKEPKLAVMSTDLVLHGFDENGEEVFEAYAFKPEPEMTKRTSDKLAIEQRYWQEKGIRWKLYTSKDFSRYMRLANLFLYEFVDLSIPISELDQYVNIFISFWENGNQFKSFEWLLTHCPCPEHQKPLKIFSTAFYLRLITLKFTGALQFDYPIDLDRG